jgi:hypothetical protein
MLEFIAKPSFGKLVGGLSHGERLISRRAHCNRTGVRLVLEDEEGEDEKEESIKPSLGYAKRKLTC